MGKRWRMLERDVGEGLILRTGHKMRTEHHWPSWNQPSDVRGSANSDTRQQSRSEGGNAVRQEKTLTGKLPERRRTLREGIPAAVEAKERKLVTKHGLVHVSTEGPSMRRPVENDVSGRPMNSAGWRRYSRTVCNTGPAEYPARKHGEDDKDADPRGERKEFTSSQLTKTQLIALFCKRLQKMPSKASELPDQFLELCGTESEGFAVTIGKTQLFNRKIIALVDLFLELNILPSSKELLKEEP